MLNAGTRLKTHTALGESRGIWGEGSQEIRRSGVLKSQGQTPVPVIASSSRLQI